MSPLLVDTRTPEGAGDTSDVSDAESLVSRLAWFAARDVNELSVPELDEMIAAASRGVSWTQAMRVRASAQRAKLVEAAKLKPKPGSPEPKPEKPLPKPGASRKEQQRDEDAARGAGWAPSFAVALEAGEISMDHVAALGRVRSHQHVSRFETALLCQARIHTAEDFTKYLHTWDAERDREAGVDRTATQRAKRYVSFFEDRNGLHALFAALPMLDAKKVENTLRDIANELFHASRDDGTTPTH
jgi:hypothetical protein